MTLSIQQIEELLSKITQGTWVLFDGCSWRRFGIEETQKAFIEPFVASDGHPDMIIKREDAEFICNAVPIIRQMIKERNAFRYVAIQNYNAPDSLSYSSICKLVDDEANRLAGEKP